MMRLLNKLVKFYVFGVRNVLGLFSSPLCTKYMTRYYRSNGMKIHGTPNFIAPNVWFDGTDYSLFELGECCTISAGVRLLTHDWSPHTIAKGMGLPLKGTVGVLRPISIGAHAFVGLGSILLPGAQIGEGTIVGAGSVVRGKVEPWSIVVGNPARPIGDSRDYLRRLLERSHETDLLNVLTQRLHVVKDS